MGKKGQAPHRILLAIAAMLSPLWAGAAKTNVLLIVIDDLGWADLGCYGAKFHETPNLDRFAGEAVRFTDAYSASPVCSPTRTAIVTGKYPARVGITDWIPGLDPKDERILEVVHDLHELPPSEVTVAEAFKDAGYATHFVGKWHLNENPAPNPLDHGYDSNVGGCQWGAPKKGYFSPWDLPEEANLPDGEQGEYLDDRLAAEVCGLLEKSGDRPFFIHWCGYVVHAPIQAPAPLVEKYKAKLATMPAPEREFVLEHGFQDRDAQSDPVYAAMMEAMDSAVGRVLAKLKELGIQDQTAVIFTSDNGGFSVTTKKFGPSCNRPLRAGKGWHYEGGIRVPLLVRWPGAGRAGATCAEPVISSDIYPTLLEMSGLAGRPEQHVDGLSVAPLVRGSADALPREGLFFHYPHYHGSGHAPSAAIRARDWKLIEFFETGTVELYNLKDDLSEKNDLAKVELAKRSELLGKLRAWRAAIGAEVPGRSDR